MQQCITNPDLTALDDPHEAALPVFISHAALLTWKSCVPQVAFFKHARVLDNLIEHIILGELAPES